MSAQVITARRLKSALYSCCILFMFPASSLAAEYSAEEVMRRVDEREAGDSSVSDITLVLIDRRERQRIRNLKLYSKNYGEDTKTLSLFESPADIRGTAEPMAHTRFSYEWNWDGSECELQSRCIDEIGQIQPSRQQALDFWSTDGERATFVKGQDNSIQPWRVASDGSVHNAIS